MKNIIFAIFLLLTPGMASAASLKLVDENVLGKCLTDGDCNLCHFIAILIHGTDIIIALGGILGALLIVGAGLWMVTSYGDSKRFQTGKDIINAVVVGLLIIMIAWTLVNTIMKSLYGSFDGAYQRVTGETDWSICPKNVPNPGNEFNETDTSDEDPWRT